MGRRFGRWAVIRLGEPAPVRNTPRWLCRCDCGTERLVHQTNLTGGKSISCGCIRAANNRARAQHGMKGTRVYGVWNTMIQRCHNPASISYRLYGGRGIYVCDRWRKSFAAFYQDMGAPPPGTSIDRINNDGPYSPENCRWATRAEQRANQRTARHLVFRGERKTIGQWARALGLNHQRVWARLERGWSAERALTEPIHYRGQDKRRP